MPCLDDNTVAALVEGGLPAAKAREVRKHIDTCDTCRQLAAGAAAELRSRAPEEAASLPFLGADIAVLPAGAQVERFVIVEPLGAGGMGVVYAAYDPKLDRKIALKLVRQRRTGEEALQARLIREAQLAAKLSHPNVVAIYDAGRFDNGAYVAMEYVRGQTLTRWLEHKDRHWRDIVAVFMSAGRGLAAAHDAGLVHRDFKPDNVLVDNSGRVRVVDFGLARPVSEIETGVPLLPGAVPAEQYATITHTGVMVGTPRYMAPEVLQQAPATAASDQFSFFVSLYESVCGQRAFAGARIPELLQSIHRGPELPTRSSGIPQRIVRALQTGLAIEPSERFSSMHAALAALAPRTRRWRLAAGFALAAVAMASVAWVIAPSRQVDKNVCIRAAHGVEAVWNSQVERQLAARFSEVWPTGATEIYASVQRTLARYVDRWRVLARESCEATLLEGRQSERLFDAKSSCLQRRLWDLTNLRDNLVTADDKVVRKAVDTVTDLIPIRSCDDDKALAQILPPPEEPVTRARIDALRRQLSEARSNQQVGDYDKALAVATPLMESAIVVSYAPLVAEIAALLGELRYQVGDYPAAVTQLEEALTRSAEAKDDVLFATVSIGTLRVANVQGRPERELRVLQKRAQLAVARAGRSTRLQADFDTVMSEIDYRRGDYRGAMRWASAARTLLTQFYAVDADRASLLKPISALARFTHAAGDTLGAQYHYERLIEIARASLGASHPEVALALNGLGAVRRDRGDANGALELHQQALAIQRAALRDDHPDIAHTMNHQGMAFAVLGRSAEAARALSRALQIRQRLGRDHPSVLEVHANLGMLALRNGNANEARQRFSHVLRASRDQFPPNHPNVAQALLNLANARYTLGEVAKAAAHYREAFTMSRTMLPEDHPLPTAAQIGLGVTALETGDPAAAIKHLQRAYDLRHKSGVPKRLRAEAAFALALTQPPEQARALRVEARVIYESLSDKYWLARLDE